MRNAVSHARPLLRRGLHLTAYSWSKEDQLWSEDPELQDLVDSLPTLKDKYSNSELHNSLANLSLLCSALAKQVMKSPLEYSQVEEIAEAINEVKRNIAPDSPGQEDVEIEYLDPALI